MRQLEEASGARALTAAARETEVGLSCDDLVHLTRRKLACCSGLRISSNLTSPGVFDDVQRVRDAVYGAGRAPDPVDDYSQHYCASLGGEPVGALRVT